MLRVRRPGEQEEWINLGPISKSKAEEMRQDTIFKLMHGDYYQSSQPRPYFPSFVERFLNEYAIGHLAARTIKSYREMLKPFLALFKHHRIDQIKREELEIALARWSVSERTRNIALSVLRAVFRKATDWRLLNSSPVAGISRFKETSQGSRALTDLELTALWGDLTPWQRSVLVVLAYSGMRPGELSNLQWRDVNFEANTLTVANDATRKTKTRRSREIPMSPDLRSELEYLKEWLPVLTSPKLAPRPRKEHQKVYVFCREDGTPVKSFRKAIHNAFAKHKIEGVTPHGMRKTFCTGLARKGVNPKLAQKLLGHSDVATTLRVYTETDDNQLVQAVHTLPTLKQLSRHKLSLIEGKTA